MQLDKGTIGAWVIKLIPSALKALLACLIGAGAMGFGYIENVKTTSSELKGEVAILANDVGTVKTQVDRIYDFIFRSVAER